MMVICVTNRALCPRGFLEQLALIGKARPDTVILRERDLDDAAYEKLARECMAALSPFGVPLTIHARPEIARAIGARRVHLPFSMLEPQADLLVSCSVHTPEEAAAAQARGADLLIAGHVFQTDCKKGVPPRGPAFLKEVCEQVSIPVYAIGGIAPENAYLVRSCGAAGGCMMSALMRAEDPQEIIQTYRASWERRS